MYVLPTSNYLRRSLLVNNHASRRPYQVSALSHKENVKQQLRNLGVSKAALMTSESQYLPYIIHPNEVIGGVVYGRHKSGYAMIVATNKRVIFLDKKPLFVNEDELTYDVVSGVANSSVGIASTVTLHTRIKDYEIRTMNPRCADNFVKYIESRRLEYELNNDGPWGNARYS